MISLERIKKQRFVCLRDIQIWEASFIRQVELPSVKSQGNQMLRNTWVRRIEVGVGERREYGRVREKGGIRGEGIFGTSVVAVRIVRPGSLVFIFMYTASFGWTRITNSLRAIFLKIPLVTSLNWMRISVFCSFNATISIHPRSLESADPES